MRPPVLAVAWIGDRRPLPPPIALSLLWPLAAIAALACAGLRIDVRSRGSSGIRFRIL